LECLEEEKKNRGIRLDLSEADLRKRNLSKADLRAVNFFSADLREANLREADLREANLSGADLSEADLRQANLREVNLRWADLRQADLRGAVLRRAQLVETDLREANLAGCAIYGISAWRLQLEGANQTNLIITPPEERTITVDDLEVAQFIYLLLSNQNIRRVIDTITSKAVLILGRFTPARKAILDTIREELRRRNYLPILFDFEPSPRRDLTETIQLLANLCRFVVADVTDAKSLPQELSHIIPFMPSVPVQPILLAAQTEYAIFEHWRKFNSVLPVFLYQDERHLLDNFEACVIKPVERWEEAIKKAVANERLLQERIQRLEAENAKLRALQSA
jgi:hypothetical protein